MYSNYDDMVYGQMYRNVAVNPMNKPQGVTEEVISLSDAIELIKKSVGDEREDEIFYESLIKSAPTTKEKTIIMSIRDDERKHNQILRYVYLKLTGNMIPIDNQSNIQDINNFNTSTQTGQYVTTQVSNNINQSGQYGITQTSNNTPPRINNSNVQTQNNSINTQKINSNSYKTNLEKALFGELDAVKKYRRIMGTMPDNESYTLIMSIMTDELRHADKYNYLLSL